MRKLPILSGRALLAEVILAGILGIVSEVSAQNAMDGATKLPTIEVLALPGRPITRKKPADGNAGSRRAARPPAAPDAVERGAVPNSNSGAIAQAPVSSSSEKSVSGADVNG